MERINEQQLSELIRQKYGSCVQFSKKIDVSRPTIIRTLEKGVNNTSVSTASKILSGLGVTFRQVVGPFSDSTHPRISPNYPDAQKLYKLYLDSPEAQVAINSLLGYSIPSMEKAITTIINKQYGGQNRFAQAIGLSKSTLSNILSKGFDSATVSHVNKICAGLSISIDDIINYERRSFASDLEANKFFMLYKKYPHAQPAINMLLHYTPQ